jgi:hypothetical protein
VHTSQRIRGVVGHRVGPPPRDDERALEGLGGVGSVEDEHLGERSVETPRLAQRTPVVPRPVRTQLRERRLLTLPAASSSTHQSAG